jgi:hypothetical protein
MIYKAKKLIKMWMNKQQPTKYILTPKNNTIFFLFIFYKLLYKNTFINKKY